MPPLGNRKVRGDPDFLPGYRVIRRRGDNDSNVSRRYRYRFGIRVRTEFINQDLRRSYSGLIIGQKVLGSYYAIGRDEVIAWERNAVERMILWNIRIEDSERANNNAALVG